MKTNGTPLRMKEKRYAAARRQKRKWLTGMTCLAAAVVFGISYALILPAVTLEKEPAPECVYTVHEHEEGCYDGDGNVVCGYADYVVHSHQEDYCYDADGALICKLPEITLHEHDSSCYGEQSVLVCEEAGDDGHEHDSSCYEEAALICGKVENDGHEHDSSCYGDSVLICEETENDGHEHDSSCYEEQPVLVCGEAENDGHVHEDSCYTAVQGGLCCEIEDEEHVHTDEYYSRTEELTCGMAEGEGAHRHGDACYQTGDVLICGMAEGAHQHGADCYQTGDALICGREEGEGAHRHGVDCYQAGTTPVCGKEEAESGHQHNDACYRIEEVLTCAQDEVVLHTHTEECWEDVSGGDGESAGQKLICGKLQVEEHQHDAECMKIPSADGAMLLQEREIPKRIPIDANYTIYPGSVDENGVWTAYDGTWDEKEEADSAATKITVTLPEGVRAAENHYLYITKIKDADDPNAPTDDMVQDAAGHVQDYQTYAIHWIEIYPYDKAKFDENTYTIENDVIQKDDTPVGVLYTDSDEDGKGENVQWVCIYTTESVLNDDAEATVEIGYLDEKAYLEGDAQTRALQIFNYNDSDRDDGVRTMHEVGHVTGISVDGNCYTGFTFTTAYAGPYVFVSKELDADAYVSALTVSSIVDGTAPFDGDDEDGHDKDGSNKRVRTFDSITYDVVATFTPRISTATAEEANVHFEISLRKGVTEAAFDLDAMNWLKAGENYQIEYLDENGKVLVVQKSDGKYYRDDNNDGIYDEPTSINARANGSNDAHPYKVETGVVEQRLSGVYTLKATEANRNVLSGTQSFSSAISVLNAEKGDCFEPTFRIWFEGNEANFTQSSDSLETKSDANVLTLDGDNAVTVTCAPLFDLQLAKDIYLAYNSWYDFATGQEVTDPDLLKWLTTVGSLRENWGKSDPAKYTTNDPKDKDGNVVDISGLSLTEIQKGNLGNIRYGQMNTLSLALHLANQSGSEKGMKGVSLPVGDIRFDLQLSATASQTSNGTLTKDELAEYYAVLWDYNENVSNTNVFTYEDGTRMQGETTLHQGNMDRNLYWDLIAESAFGVNAPFNYNGATNGGEVRPGYVYNGGSIAMTAVNGSAEKKTSAYTGNNAIYSFSLSGYDFDLDNWSFPTQNRGENYSGNVRAYGITQFCFFGGMAQVLNVYPYTQKETVTIKYEYTAGNLELTTASNDVLNTKGEPGTRIDYSNEVKGYNSQKVDEGNKDEDTSGYNRATGTVTLYSPGSFSKHNWFGEKDGFKSLDTDSRFNGNEWDAAAMAGADISIVGRTQLSTSASSWIGASNYLQLYDSAGLYVRPVDDAVSLKDSVGAYITNKQITVNRSYGSKEEEGTSTVLFAADPDYPAGYDTNRGSGSDNGSDIMDYMNTVQEEDLVYSAKVYQDANGNYTLIWYDFNKDGQKTDDEMLACVGFLVEQRDCKYKNYSYYTFPVTVAKEPELVGKTICTVNGLRAWATDNGDAKAMSGVSWLNGQWNAAEGKNSVVGYKTITQKTTTDHDNNGWLMNNTDKPYTKAEYNAEGGLASGHTNGEIYGNTLLILGYEAEVQINAAKEFYNLDQVDGSSVQYTLSNIKTDTKTTASANINGDKTDLQIKVAMQAIDPNKKVYSNQGQDYVCISQGSLKITVGDQKYEVGTDANNPTEVIFKVGDKEYSYEVYAEIDTNGTGMTVHLLGAPVDQTLPDITFMANLGSKIENNSTVFAAADISGTGYNHAYSSINGMHSNCTVSIIVNSSTQLTKTVDTTMIELNGIINYTVSYTNSSADAVQVAYFYDLLPYNGDGIRGTDIDAGDNSSLSLVGAAVKAADGTTVGTGNGTNVTLYFSTERPETLENEIKYFGGNAEHGNEEAIQEWLPQGDNIKGTYFTLLGTVSADGGSLQRAQWIIDAYGDLNDKNEWKCPDSKNYKDYDEAWEAYVNDYLSKVTCVFLKVENIAAGNTAQLTLQMTTNNNSAANTYGNEAWCWNPASGGPIKSTIVQTKVLSRTISGVVWYDADLDGVRDSNEAVIPGVTATLFVKEGKGSYKACTKDVTGGEIGSVKTDENGSYCFGKLAAGDYLVAFSGEVLGEYKGATFYQVNGGNDIDTNDGVALTSTQVSLDTEMTGLGLGEEYKYAIAYHIGSDARSGAAAGDITMPLHTIQKIVGDNLPLVNYVELYERQDLGLVIAGYELPKTGGTGTALFTVGGLLLMAGAAGCGYGLRRRRGRRAEG